MPTNFLNRRMDLHHSYKNGVNYLTMDTSYEVRLAGTIMKIFKASNTYTDGNWILVNSENKNILTVNKNKVYDFGNNVIRDNVDGEEKIYPTRQDVYKEDDYVIAIIDFDNSLIKLLSQTNFDHIYMNLESSDTNLKMFDISGDDIVNGISEALSQEAFNSSADYESRENAYALMRRDSDLVVYQAPKIDGDECSYVPVAKVENKNINKFNVSVLPLLYPSINTGYVDSFDNVISVKSLTQLNGKVNDSFVEEFCYTAAEIAALKADLLDSKHAVDEYMFYFYNGIDDEDKDNYVYFIRDSITYKNNSFTNVFFGPRQTQIIIPVLKDGFKLCSIENNGPEPQTLSNGALPELNYMFSPVSGYMIGNWWRSSFDVDSDDGMVWSKLIDYEVLVHMPIDRSVYSYILNRLQADSRTHDNGVMFEYNSYSVAKGANSGINTETFYQFHDSVLLANNTSQLRQCTVPMITSHDVDDVFENDSNLTFVNQFINFFGNDDAEYKEYLKDTVSKAVNYTGKGAYTFDYPYTDTGTFSNNDVLPNPIASVYLEDLSNKISTTTLKNLSNDQTFDKNAHRYKLNSQAYNVEEMEYLMYLMLFYKYDDINTDAANLNILKDSRNVIRTTTAESGRFRFKVSKDLLPRSTDNSYGIFVNDKEGVDQCERWTKYIGFEFSKLMARAIDYHYDDDRNLYADVVSTRRMGFTRIKFAKTNTYISSNSSSEILEDRSLEYEEIDGHWYLNMRSALNTYTPLYIVTYENNSSGTFERATYENVCDAISYNGCVFLYHADYGKSFDDPSAETAFRIRYCVDINRINEYKQHSDNPNDAIGTYDFYTEPVKACKKDQSNYDGRYIYDRAYICFDSSRTNHSLDNVSMGLRIATVDFNYCISGYGNTKDHIGIMNNIVDGIPNIVVKTHPSYGTITTVGIALSGYAMLNYRISNDVSILDMFPEGTTIYTNGPAPKLSKIRNKNNDFIFNSASYSDFISNVFVTQETKNIDSNVYMGIYSENTVPPILSEVALKYAGAIGIREEYYKNKSFLEFLNSLTMYDMSKPIDQQNVDAIKYNCMPVYKKGTFDNIFAKSPTPIYLIKSNFLKEEDWNEAVELTTGAVFFRLNNATLEYYDTAASSEKKYYKQNSSGEMNAVRFTVSDMSTKRVKVTGVETDPDTYEVNNVTFWVEKDFIAMKYDDLFLDVTNHPMSVEAPVSIVSKINYVGNRYGFNDSYIYKTNRNGTEFSSEDVTSSYVSLDKMYASQEEAGNKSVMNISLNDENGVMLNINGTLGTIEIDLLNWYTLLMALSNNKNIDILSEALRGIKSDLNNVINDNSQYVSDTVTYAQNVSPDSQTATFNEKYNLYDYIQSHYGAIKNRGAIVIINDEDGIHLKRMYISKDGLLCTKEFFDAEAALGKSILERLTELET